MQILNIFSKITCTMSVTGKFTVYKTFRKFYFSPYFWDTLLYTGNYCCEDFTEQLLMDPDIRRRSIITTTMLFGDIKWYKNGKEASSVQRIVYCILCGCPFT